MYYSDTTPVRSLSLRLFRSARHSVLFSLPLTWCGGLRRKNQVSRCVTTEFLRGSLPRHHSSSWGSKAGWSLHVVALDVFVPCALGFDSTRERGSYRHEHRAGHKQTNKKSGTHRKKGAHWKLFSLTGSKSLGKRNCLWSSSRPTSTRGSSLT